MDTNKRTRIAEINSEAIILEDLDAAIIGISECGKVIYSVSLIYDELVKQGMPLDDVIEYVDYNILYAYLGEFTPIYIYYL
jgi:hypothetical protein